MSLWDKYLAPGDLRRRQQLLANPPSPVPQDANTPTKQELQKLPRIDSANRQRRQDALLYGGLVFSCLSLLVTRRALLKKHLPFPKTFTPSNAPPPKGDGALDAAEALGLASLNVFSLAMVAAGGTMKWFDIADVEDMREGVRKSLGYDVYSGDSEADKELEGWVAGVLSQKDDKGGFQESIARKLKELEEMERKRKESEKR